MKLPAWMHFVLRFGGIYNILAGLAMIACYHEGFKALGVPKPEFVMPIQLVGVLVAIFGIGYLLADRNPAQNKNVILLGLLSKLLGPLLAIVYVVRGELPPAMLGVLFFADVIYLIPFWMIYQKIDRNERMVAARLAFLEQMTLNATSAEAGSDFPESPVKRVA